MVKRVKDENGLIHSFPDDATEDEMNSTFLQMEKENKPFNLFEGIKKDNPQDVSRPQDVAENFKQGFRELGQRGKQLYLDAFGNPTDAQNYTREAQNQRKAFEASPAGQDQQAGIFRGFINESPYMIPVGRAAQGVTKGAGLLGRMLKSGATTGAISATEFVPEGESRLKNIATGATVGAALPAVSEATTLIPKLINKVRPIKASQNLLQDLGKGAANTEEATSSIIKDIQKSHDIKEKEAVSFLEPALNKAGEERIYETVNPLISTKMDKAKDMIEKVKDLQVGDLYDAFKKNPNFKNAHNLQSELGVLIGDIQKIPGKTNAERLQLKNIKSIRDRLKEDMGDFLKKRDLKTNESLAPNYQKGIDLYRENVAPYLSNQKLRQINRERRTSVPNVHKIFESPYDIAEKLTGKTKEGPITKILNDLSQDTKDKILFRKLGGHKNSDNPTALLKAAKNTEQEGYSKLFNQDVKNKLLDIQNKSRNKKILKVAGGLAGIGSLEELVRKAFK